MKTYMAIPLWVLSWVFLSGCAPAPHPETDDDTQLKTEQSSGPEPSETQKQKILEAKIKNLKQETKALAGSIAKLEAEMAETSSETLSSDYAEKMKSDTIRLHNGNQFSAEVIEIKGRQITISLNGTEKTGELRVIKEIHFRTGE